MSPSTIILPQQLVGIDQCEPHRGAVTPGTNRTATIIHVVPVYYLPNHTISEKVFHIILPVSPDFLLKTGTV